MKSNKPLASDYLTKKEKTKIDERIIDFLATADIDQYRRVYKTICELQGLSN